jgi:hypothetical protein
MLSNDIDATWSSSYELRKHSIGSLEAIYDVLVPLGRIARVKIFDLSVVNDLEHKI